MYLFVVHVCTQDEMWIMMDYCSGGSLDKIVRHKRCLSEEQVAYVCYCLVDALVYLHGKAIVHGDIKGSNLLLTARGELRVADFGVSKQRNANTDDDTRVCGSPLWMAP